MMVHIQCDEMGDVKRHCEAACTLLQVSRRYGCQKWFPVSELDVWLL